jgi:hypothetical protein
MRTDNALAQLALIRSGAGIGVCQALIAQRDQDRAGAPKTVRSAPGDGGS